MCQAHEEGILKGLGLYDKKTFKTYEYFGNTGFKALPLTLSLLKDSGKIKQNEKNDSFGNRKWLELSNVGGPMVKESKNDRMIIPENLKGIPF